MGRWLAGVGRIKVRKVWYNAFMKKQTGKEKLLAIPGGRVPAGMGDYLAEWSSGAGSLGAAGRLLAWEIDESVGQTFFGDQEKLWCDLEKLEQLALGRTFWRLADSLEWGDWRWRLDGGKVWQWWRWRASWRVAQTWWRWRSDPPEAVTMVEGLVRAIPEPGVGLVAGELVMARKVWPAVVVSELAADVMQAWARASVPAEKKDWWEGELRLARGHAAPARMSELDEQLALLPGKVRRVLTAAVELEGWRQAARERAAEHLAVLAEYLGAERENVGG